MESVPISFILKEASKHLINVLGTEFTLIKNTPGELEKLKRFKTIIVTVQRDVAGRELSQQDVVWLDEMIDAAYDIEDIVDLSSTKILQLRSNNNEESTCCIHWVIDFFSCTYNTLIFRHEIGTRVQNTFVRLANIAEEKKYHLTHSGRDGVENLSTKMPETISEMGEDVVLGRDRDLKIILEQLLFKEKTNIDVLVLVGMGGVGKTTLAKLVYNDSQVDALFGERKLWVCVSEIFDSSKIIKLVIEQIDGNPCKLEGLQALSKKLKELLETNMYLLVLDDVWTNSSLTCDSWSIMKSLFLNCKILVTTREENVISVILPEPYMHRVGCLPEDASWSLFKNIAFSNGNVPEELKDISKSIVKKCKGVPLAVRVLGSMMRNQNFTYWKEIEKNNILDLNIEGENRISKILKFSYHNLPLKSKFYSVMKKIKLIQQWAGNGFISLNEGNKIFEDLLSRCFFQDVEKDDYGSITIFKMHDLIHDLAESIAKSLQCGIFDDRIQDRNLSDRKQVRYLSIILNMGEGEEFSYSDISSKLRTLQLLTSTLVTMTFLDNCFTKFKFLRVLVCSYQYGFEEIPSSIDNLKLLRYVDFCHTGITRLPETVCNLQNLQTLKLNNCRDLIVLSKKLGKLSELRYLENDDCISLDSMPVGMDRLSLLQTLNTFVVNDGGKNLNELRHLDHLEGSLCIKHLDRIQNVVLENGILNRKSNLVSLDLIWGLWIQSKRRDYGKVLEALQPHPNLKYLNINGFDGFFIPLDMSCLKSLTYLVILHCKNLTCLPNNIGSLKSLTHLEIYYCPNVTSLPNDMSCLKSLTHLVILHCKNLTCFPNNIGSLKSLTHLDISCCENLTCLPNNMGSLKSLTHLEISGCKNLTCLPDNMGSLKSLTYLKILRCKNLTCLPNSMGSLKSLTYLKILRCKNLTCLPNSMCSLKSLTYLEIKFCKNLTCLPNNMGSFKSLTHLVIYYCPNLTSLPNDMGSLKSLTHLKISSCKKLTCLPNNMGSLKSLIHLQISYCENLSCLPNNMGSLKSLTHLEISNCKNLTCLPNNMEISFCENLTCLPNNMGCLQSLTPLTIESCPSLVDNSFALECLTSLKEIEVAGCDQWIRNWSDDAITRFFSVEEGSLISICIKDDDIDLLSRWLRKKIEYSTKITQTLIINGDHRGSDFYRGRHHLSICCFKQEKLPEELVHVQDLQIMAVENCPNLNCLPNGMKKPQFLKIENCPMLEKNCEERGYEYGDEIESIMTFHNF
ncbi:hypothetical protein ZOSMA_87G00830 [Zostera marina]|uniref:NB-ARC domain-containing disease resistance protein n=1 Tax=Zostera marina TaxID=29655 RepID=A0A0K9NMN2_ZOSMR|nr:hypothetical protein ZOSMA_87G00830 [Zostera marina]